MKKNEILVQKRELHTVVAFDFESSRQPEAGSQTHLIIGWVSQRKCTMS